MFFLLIFLVLGCGDVHDPLGLVPVPRFAGFRGHFVIDYRESFFAFTFSRVFVNVRVAETQLPGGFR